MIALYAFWYNFIRIHKTLRVTPAMESRLTDRLWTFDDAIGLIDAWESERGYELDGDITHRLAHLVNVPEGYHENGATVSQLQALVGRYFKEPAPGAKSTTGADNGRTLDMEKLLEDNNVRYTKRGWSSGWKYILSACLFNPDHTRTSAAILQFPSGAIDYECLHNECANKTWHDARDILQPSWRNAWGLTGYKSDVGSALTISVTHRRIRDMTGDALVALKAANALHLRFFQQGKRVSSVAVRGGRNAKLGVNEKTISRWVNDKEAIGGQIEKALRRFVGDMLRDRAPKIDFKPDDIWSMDIAMICKGPLLFEFSLISDEKTEALEELWKQGSGRRAVNA